MDGPPIFIKTIAVGPFDPVASCVTGGTTVAKSFFCSFVCAGHNEDVGGAVYLDIQAREARFESWASGTLKVISVAMYDSNVLRY